jgi:hypothetical protein
MKILEEEGRSSEYESFELGNLEIIISIRDLEEKYRKYEENKEFNLLAEGGSP